MKKPPRYPHHPLEVTFNENDLATIRSYAIKVMGEFMPERHSTFDHDHVRTLCYVEAVIAYLRSKDLIDFAVYYNQKRKL